MDEAGALAELSIQGRRPEDVYPYPNPTQPYGLGSYLQGSVRTPGLVAHTGREGGLRRRPTAAR
jgi:hypothetical protein